MAQAPAAEKGNIWKVILASSAGTLIEWYDFYIFGSLAVILAGQFFPKDNPTAGLLFTLATFATGFVVRPFGALVFGRMGDILGRKHTFLLTLMMMGISTFASGLIPTDEMIGVAAPLIVLVLRLIQGLALGGEYGGAATYVAEHAPEGRRGYYTSFIQTTATLGLFVSLIVILITRGTLGEAEFSEWGWRIPFLISALLVFMSYMIRRKMDESPLFQKLKSEGKTSANPLTESFVKPENRRLVLIALFGATAGQGVVWYTGQFYALTFIQSVMNIQGAVASEIIAIALLCATPFFVVFGALSDRIGRKKLMMVACLLGAIGYIPIFSAMQNSMPDLTNMGAPEIKVDSVVDPVTKKTTVTRVETYQQGEIKKVVKQALISAENPVPKLAPDGKPEKPKVEITPPSSTYWTLVGLVFLQVFLVTMVYGPIAAFLVELFPTRIRYTSMSLPYHIGNGVFGGLVPFIATALVASTKNNLAGLWYPIAIAAITFVFGSLLIHERKTNTGFEEETD
ncbi:MAG: MHS family MFS transporter [Fimbriimonadaceae bacterium]|nr:MHS family MFS transporter [Fimbriimonadaceae bacterium]